MVEAAISNEAIQNVKKRFAPKQIDQKPEMSSARLNLGRYLDHHGIEYKTKANGSRIICCLSHCIFDPSHTNNDAAFFQESNGKLGYKCFHDSCNGNDWKQARQKISGDLKLTEFMDGLECIDSNQKIEKPDFRSAILENEKFLELEMPEKSIYLDPWLVAQSIILISGHRGTGKTWFALSILLAIAKGESFGPWECEKSIPCLYLDGEMAARDVQERTMTLDQTGKKKNPLFIYSDAYASSLGLPRASLLNPDWRQDIKEILLERSVKLWAIDNLASLTPGINENDKQDWDPINQFLLELRFAGITTILLHHTNKSGGQRGTSAREDNIDISIMLIQPPGYHAEDGASFIASFTKARVSTDKLSKIADTNFRLTMDEENKLVWTYGNTQRQRKEQILILKDQEWTNKDIAAELGCSVQNVNQITKRAIKDGYLTKGYKLTPSGFDHVKMTENKFKK